MGVRSKNRKSQYRAIYELLWLKNPRIYIKDIASKLCIDHRTASNRLNEAYSLGVITGPQIRKRSYSNMKEYVYFVNSKNPFKTYLKYSKDENIIYHARMLGFVNTWITALNKFHVDGEILYEGYRSDYHLSFAPDHSWEKSIQLMKKKIENFNEDKYNRNTIIETHWNESIPWDSESEKLYREFKYDLRSPITPIMKRNLISGQKIYEFLERLPDCCSITTSYFPEGISAYDPYFFLFETDYEDFIIELFSLLPTSCFFFKVADRLFAYAHIEKQLIRCEGLNMANVKQLHIPLVLNELLEKGIIKWEDHVIVEYFWSKDF